MSKKYGGEVELLQLITLIHTELEKYVKAVEGKGLSAEDFTTALKSKLDGIDLTKYPTIEEMNAAIAGVAGIEFVKPDGGVLPATGEKGKIYLIPNSSSGSNVYDEYYWDATANKFELFGSTSVDLSGYLKETDLVEITTEEVNAAWNSVFGA